MTAVVDVDPREVIARVLADAKLTLFRKPLQVREAFLPCAVRKDAILSIAVLSERMS